MLAVHPNEGVGLLKHLWLVAHYQVLRAALCQDVLRHAACIGCVQRAVDLIKEIEGRRVGGLQGKAEGQRSQRLLPTCMAQQYGSATGSKQRRALHATLHGCGAAVTATMLLSRCSVPHKLSTSSVTTCCHV
jgi:hypothetical protein